MNLSCVIPVLNDSAECLETIKSLRKTATSKLEIIVLDDCSKIPIEIPANLDVVLVRNQQRIGVDKCRHLGAEKARGDIVLLLDSHMRATDGWHENLIERVASHPNAIQNGCTLGLSAVNMDTGRFDGKPAPGPGFYCGARLSIYNPKDPSPDHRILEGKWKQHEDGAEISSCMGAIYAFPRELFFKIGGLKQLRMWGGSEQYLSLKAWLSGYEVRQCNTVRIGHKFRNIPDAPYSTETWNMPWNKMWIIQTIFPKDMADYLMSKFPETNAVRIARKKILEQQKEVEAEREFHKSIFVHDVDWFLNKFPDVDFVR